MSLVKIFALNFINIFLCCLTSTAATYYVRTDGGTSTQCTGLADAAYDGSGTGEACAFSHPAWAIGGPSGSVKMAGGDTLIIDGEHMIGYGMPNSSCSTSAPYSCILQYVPPGPDVDHKTKIYGKNYNSGCASKAQLWGTQRAYSVLQINSNTDVQCLDITDHSACIENGPLDGNIGDYPVKCVRDTYPQGTWAATGVTIQTNADNVSLQNVDVHGMAARGIMGKNVADIDLLNTRVIGNGFVGWDSDYTTDDSYSGTITLTSSKIEWNGCGEKYPLTVTDLSSSTDKHHCWSQDQGGFGDGIGLGDGSPGNWTFIDSSISWNTSDGVDLLHGNGTGTVKFIRSKAEGNASQGVKTSVYRTYIENSAVIGNCGFFSGQPFTSTKSTTGATVAFNNCRAAGTTIALANAAVGSEYYITNSTVLSNGDVMIMSSGANCDANTKIYAYNNIFLGGTEFNDGSDKSDFYYAAGVTGNGDGACGSLQITEDYNVIFNTKTIGTDCVGSNSTCSDPKFSGTILQGPGTYYTNTNYASQLQLQSSSPAINAANISAYLISNSNDFTNGIRGAMWDIGAVEYGSVFTTCSNGIQDGDETGVDCGGGCTACVQSFGKRYRLRDVLNN